MADLKPKAELKWSSAYSAFFSKFNFGKRQNFDAERQNFEPSSTLVWFEKCSEKSNWAAK